jgi:hypothetical protein
VFDDDGKPGKDRNDESIGFVQVVVVQRWLQPCTVLPRPG